MNKSTTRIKQTGEVFTPTPLVNEILNKIPIDYTDTSKTILDPSCGNGQFLIEVAKKRGSLQNIFGVDIMADNCCDTIARLLFWNKYNIDIFDGNATPIKELDYDGHYDDHSYEWLRQQSKYERFYIVDNKVVIVRKLNNSPTGCWFEYSYNDKDYDLYLYIVCADSLQFVYDEFDTIIKNNESQFLIYNNSKQVQPGIIINQPTKPIDVPRQPTPSKESTQKIVLTEQDKLQQEIDKLDSQLELTKSDFNQWKKLYDKRGKLQYQLNKILPY